MNKHILTFGLVAALLGGQAVAEENDSAQTLFDKDCARCHETDASFTRKDRKVQSLDQLDSQIRWCESNFGLHWGDNEIAKMTAYLNDRYYHFTP